MIRTSGVFADVSSQCDEPHRNGGAPLPPTSGSYTACKRLLSRVPTVLAHIDKKLQQHDAVHQRRDQPGHDARSWAGRRTTARGRTSTRENEHVVTQVIYGDGGNAGYDATNPTWRFNEFTSGFSDSNFRDGDPGAWVITSAPVVTAARRVPFYWPQIGDPNPVPGTHPIYSGAKHVLADVGVRRRPSRAPCRRTRLPISPSTRTNCPEFVVSGANPACGDYRPLGGPFCDGLASTPTVPSCANQPGDLTGTVYGGDRSGGSVSWIARDGADHGTIWAATSAGRIFVTHNGDASDPAAVVWHRIDNATSPTRFPSGIYVDPGRHRPRVGHVLRLQRRHADHDGSCVRVNENGTVTPGSGTFTNLNVESGTSAFPTPTNDGDLPISDVVRDDANADAVRAARTSASSAGTTTEPAGT